MDFINRSAPPAGRKSDAPRPSKIPLGEGVMDNSVGGYSGFMTRGGVVRVADYQFTYLGKGGNGDALLRISHGTDVVAEKQAFPWGRKTPLETGGKTISVTPNYTRSTCAYMEIEVERR